MNFHPYITFITGMFMGLSILLLIPVPTHIIIVKLALAAMGITLTKDKLIR